MGFILCFHLDKVLRILVWPPTRWRMTESSAILSWVLRLLVCTPHPAFLLLGIKLRFSCMLDKLLPNWATVLALFHCAVKSYQANLNCLHKWKEPCLTSLDFTSKQVSFHLKRWRSVPSLVMDINKLCSYCCIYKDYCGPNLSIGNSNDRASHEPDSTL